jgi:polyphosphate glucokinase
LPRSSAFQAARADAQDGLPLGIDIGGTEIKAGLVDVRRGRLVGPRMVARTPHPATPAAVSRAIGELVRDVPEPSGVGLAYPGVIVDGTVRTAVNLHPDWHGTSLSGLARPHLGSKVAVLNDADAAGVAESRYGAGRGHDGLMLVLTFGTGIGTALVDRGRLIANAELGHLEVDGHDAELSTAASAIQREQLTWPQWARRVNRYLAALERLLWPSLVVIGGGVSSCPGKWLPHLSARARIATAQLSNNAGIVGAALMAHKLRHADHDAASLLYGPTGGE